MGSFPFIIVFLILCYTKNANHARPSEKLSYNFIPAGMAFPVGIMYNTKKIPGGFSVNKKYLKRYPLGNAKRGWKQDKFILSTFSPASLDYHHFDPNGVDHTRRAVQTCADAGFNLLELGWARPDVSEAAVQMCEALGIDIIYQNLSLFGGMQGNIWSKDPDQGIRDCVERFRKYRHVLGFYVWDEPLTKEQITLARTQMDAFEALAPNDLLFTVAIPSYNADYTHQNGLFADYLERYVNEIEPPVLSLDYYPVGMREHDTTRQLDESLIWCDLGLMKQLAAKKNMPMWFYYQGQNLHHVDFFIFPMVRLMMHAGILYGAKGLQHYTALEAVTRKEDGGHDIFFEDQKAIHAQLHKLGNTLMALDCKRVIHDDSLLPGCPYIEGLRNNMTESELLAGTLPYRTSVSELEDAYGNRYLIVLNRDYLTEKTVQLQLKESSHVYAVSKEDGEQKLMGTSLQTLDLQLIPGDMALLRIQSATEDPYLIDYILEK